MIPIGTDYRLRSIPWTNYALIATNVLIFIFAESWGSPKGLENVRPWILDPASPRLMQFFSSVFLHGSFWHLVGNMLFLWVFGNALNDRFGHVGYLAFYLAGGVFAGVGYMLMSGDAPVLGASGAIAAATGGYLVLFPRTRVTVLLPLLYVLLPFELPSLLFLLFQFAHELFMSFQVSFASGGHVRVAHWAHSSGYLFGIAVSAALLATRVLPRDSLDLLSLIRSWRRRSSYRRMATDGHDPFANISPDLRREEPPILRVGAPTVVSTPPDTPVSRDLQLRREVSEACLRGDLRSASASYLRLVQVSENAVLSRQQQLDVANQLMSSERYPAAADAYERFCKHYGTYEHLADIHLMLGLVYGRYLHQYDRAEQYLTRAIDGLTDERKLELARGDLQAVRARRGQ